MKPAHQITDRAKRYRANRNPPPGRKVCNFCGRRRNIDVDHVTGDESDDSPENKMFLCRPCNTRKGITQARNRIGVRTRQFNPWKIPTFAQFKHHAAVLLGVEKGDVGESTELVRSTPPDTRAAYAEKLAANPESPTYAQYAHGVSIHRRGAHDEGGAIIHATPPALRRKYAEKIAAIKAKRGRMKNAEEKEFTIYLRGENRGSWRVDGGIFAKSKAEAIQKYRDQYNMYVDEPIRALAVGEPWPKGAASWF